MVLKGSEIVLECLLEEGVDTVFGYPGGSVIPLYDALFDYRDKFTHILTSHEQGATHAADGYARSTGKVGVVFATSGPGATNTVTGIATAYLDSVPIVVITGQVGRSYIGKDSFQEIDITSITMPITKHNFLVKEAKDLAETVRRAFRIAKSGRPGPVLIDVPKDIFTEMAEYTKVEEPKEPQVLEVEDFDLSELIDCINNSEKPLIYAGGGIITSDTAKYLREFTKKCDVPVVNSLMAHGVLEDDDFMGLGHVGMHGHRVSNHAISNCDLLIALGTRFSDRVASHTDSFAEQAKIVQVDVDPAEIGKNKDVDYYIRADLKDLMPRLVEEAPERNNSEWLEELKRVKEIDGVDNTSWNERNILRTIKRAMGENTVVATDVGQHQMWVSQYYGFSRPRQLLTSAGLGTMGYGLGAAIGAKVGNPDKNVLLVTGDGSFRMNLNELATVHKYELPLVVVVMNNQTLGMVRQWQNIFQQKRFSETDITDDVDFVKLADAFKLKGARADNFEDLEAAIKEALDTKSAMVIDVIIDKNDMVLPMIPAGGTYDDIIFN